jgi:hypothetical protein
MVLEQPKQGGLLRALLSPKGLLITGALATAAGLGGWKLWNTRMMNNIISTGLEVFRDFDVEKLGQKLDGLLANREGSGFSQDFERLETETKAHVDKLLGMYRDVRQGERQKAAERFRSAIGGLFDSARQSEGQVPAEALREAREATAGFATKVVNYRFNKYDSIRPHIRNQTQK